MFSIYFIDSMIFHIDCIWSLQASHMIEEAVISPKWNPLDPSRDQRPVNQGELRSSRSETRFQIPGFGAWMHGERQVFATWCVMVRHGEIGHFKCAKRPHLRISNLGKSAQIQWVESHVVAFFPQIPLKDLFRASKSIGNRIKQHMWRSAGWASF